MDYLWSVFHVIFIWWQQFACYLTNAEWKHIIDCGWAGVIVWIVGAYDWYSCCVINLLNRMFLFPIRQLLNLYKAFKMALQNLPVWMCVWVNICMQAIHITFFKQKKYPLRDFELIFLNTFFFMFSHLQFRWTLEQIRWLIQDKCFYIFLLQKSS